MSQCLCLTENNRRCKNPSSKKIGTNPHFCWLHQKCQKEILITKNSPFSAMINDAIPRHLLDVWGDIAEDYNRPIIIRHTEDPDNFLETIIQFPKNGLEIFLKEMKKWKN